MDIQVGQQWRTRGGGVREVVGYDHNTNTAYVWDLDDGSSVTADGIEQEMESGPGDLIELVIQPAETPTPPAPAQPDTLRLTIAASIYAGMLVTQQDEGDTRESLARRALSHADILIQEAAK